MDATYHIDRQQILGIRNDPQKITQFWNATKEAVADESCKSIQVDIDYPIPKVVIHFPGKKDPNKPFICDFVDSGYGSSTNWDMGYLCAGEVRKQTKICERAIQFVSDFMKSDLQKYDAKTIRSAVELVNKWRRDGNRYGKNLYISQVSLLTDAVKRSRNLFHQTPKSKEDWQKLSHRVKMTKLLKPKPKNTSLDDPNSPLNESLSDLESAERKVSAWYINGVINHKWERDEKEKELRNLGHDDENESWSTSIGSIVGEETYYETKKEPEEFLNRRSLYEKEFSLDGCKGFDEGAMTSLCKLYLNSPLMAKPVENEFLSAVGSSLRVEKISSLTKIDKTVAKITNLFGCIPSLRTIYVNDSDLIGTIQRPRGVDDENLKHLGINEPSNYFCWMRTLGKPVDKSGISWRRIYRIAYKLGVEGYSSNSDVGVEDYFSNSDVGVEAYFSNSDKCFFMDQAYDRVISWLGMQDLFRCVRPWKFDMEAQILVGATSSEDSRFGQVTEQIDKVDEQGAKDIKLWAGSAMIKLPSLLVSTITPGLCGDRIVFDDKFSSVLPMLDELFRGHPPTLPEFGSDEWLPTVKLLLELIDRDSFESEEWRPWKNKINLHYRILTADLFTEIKAVLSQNDPVTHYALFKEIFETDMFEKLKEHIGYCALNRLISHGLTDLTVGQAQDLGKLIITPPELTSQRKELSDMVSNYLESNTDVDRTQIASCAEACGMPWLVAS